MTALSRSVRITSELFNITLNSPNKNNRVYDEQEFMMELNQQIDKVLYVTSSAGNTNEWDTIGIVDLVDIVGVVLSAQKNQDGTVSVLWESVGLRALDLPENIPFLYTYGICNFVQDNNSENIIVKNYRLIKLFVQP